jgi:hypothetical protein
MKKQLLTISLILCVVVGCISMFDTGNTRRTRTDSAGLDANDDSLTIKSLLDSGPTKIVPTAEEKMLHSSINQYRAQKGLTVIPYSKSLAFVAKIHARDLYGHPQKEPCNMHSWSKDGPWSAGCYTPDHKLAKIMWDKPRELTTYTGNGFEISKGAWYSTGYLGAADSLAGWQESPDHNAVMINKGVWKNTVWKAMGTGIYRNYAVVWFGEIDDPER